MISFRDALNALVFLSVLPPIVGTGVGYLSGKAISLGDKSPEKVTATFTAHGGFIGIISAYLVLLGGLIALPTNALK